MPPSQASRRDRTRVCTNAVFAADDQGIATLMDRLGRLVRRQEYGHEAMTALHTSVEQAIRDLSRSSNGEADAIHAWFTIGPREIDVRLENEPPNRSKGAAAAPSSRTPPPELVAAAAVCALRLIQYRADDWSVSMSWRRIPSEHVDDRSFE